ncbi:MAG: hypothetical protein R3F30_02070 [Planctomycetota bacterium]
MQSKTTGRLAPLALCLSLAAAPLAAQTKVYDDFTSSKLGSTWFAWGNSQYWSLSGGYLRLVQPVNHNEYGFVTLDGIDGDFEVVLKFANYNSTNRAGNEELTLHVFDFMGPADKRAEAEVLIGRKWVQQGTTQVWRTFVGAVATDPKAVHKPGEALANQMAAGELRIARDKTGITCAFREASTLAWTTVVTWPDYLRSIVHVEIEMNTGQANAVTVDVDSLSYSGTLRPGPIRIGTGCGAMDAVAGSIPFLGNADFFIYGGSTALPAKVPTLGILGGTQYQQGLPLGPIAPGCSLYTLPDFVAAAGLTDSEGFAVFPLPIPTDQQLLGVGFVTQVLAVRCGFNQLCGILSNGVLAKVEKP